MIDVTGFKEEFLAEFAKIDKEEMLKWFDEEERKDKERRIEESSSFKMHSFEEYDNYEIEINSKVNFAKIEITDEQNYSDSGETKNYSLAA